MTAKSMSVQILASFLCLIIFAAALDTLPDPPAVKPQSSQNNSVSQLACQLAVATLNHVLDYLRSSVHLQAGFISIGQGFEVQRPAAVPFIRQATDTSPPRLC